MELSTIEITENQFSKETIRQIKTTIKHSSPSGYRESNFGDGGYESDGVYHEKPFIYHLSSDETYKW